MPLSLPAVMAILVLVTGVAVPASAQEDLVVIEAAVFADAAFSEIVVSNLDGVVLHSVVVDLYEGDVAFYQGAYELDEVVISVFNAFKNEVYRDPAYHFNAYIFPRPDSRDLRLGIAHQQNLPEIVSACPDRLVTVKNLPQGAHFAEVDGTEQHWKKVINLAAGRGEKSIKFHTYLPPRFEYYVIGNAEQADQMFSLPPFAQVLENLGLEPDKFTEPRHERVVLVAVGLDGQLYFESQLLRD